MGGADGWLGAGKGEQLGNEAGQAGRLDLVGQRAGLGHGGLGAGDADKEEREGAATGRGREARPVAQRGGGGLVGARDEAPAVKETRGQGQQPVVGAVVTQE